MNKMKKLIKILKIDNVKYFAILAILCFSLVSIFRPIVQNNMDSIAVSAQPQPAKKNLPIYCVDTDEKKVSQQVLTLLGEQMIQRNF